MHAALSEEVRTSWSYVGLKLGHMAGVPQEGWVHLQASLGIIEIPPESLFAEAHGLNWSSMVDRAVPVIDPQLEPQQREQLQQRLASLGSK